MPLSDTTLLRLRHALRAASGGSIIALLSLATNISAGCLPSVVFFISVIAATPENLQGFQLRSASLTFLGAVLGITAYSLVHLIASTSAIGTFFAAIPFIVFFSALRPNPHLTPLPPVANVLLGLLTISQFPSSISALKQVVPAALIDVTFAYIVANVVNLAFADRASDAGRRIVARELRNLGAHISRIATQTFSQPQQHPQHNSFHSTSDHLTLFMDRGHRDTLSSLHEQHYLFRTKHASHASHHHLERTELMQAEAHASLHYLKQLPPLSRTRVENFSNLAIAARFFAASTFEPCLIRPTISRWRNASTWKKLVNDLQVLMSKVASLESVAMQTESRPRFSAEQLCELFGEAFLPLWVAHYAACSAACAVMSTAMYHATCRDMFHLDDTVHDGFLLHPNIDPRKWKNRRAEMYSGFLMRYRHRMTAVAAREIHSHASVADFRNVEGRSTWSTSGRQHHGGTTQQYARQSRSVEKDITSSDSEYDSLFTTQQKRPSASKLSMAQRQALSFFGITSHALSEEIGHVQLSMVELASSTDARGLFAPFYFVVSSIPLLVKRVKDLVRGDVQAWEVRFVFTHSTLLLVILALALFLPLRDTFEASEIAWVFTSAALAAQLSAEPTLFIGAIRVVATVTGGVLAFGFNSLLDALGRKEHDELNYIIVPYVFVTTVVSLMVLPTKFRYASFLNIVTNTVLLFCPRATEECNQVLGQQTTQCFPDWQYAISRAANVSIGVVFALVFHLLFWPRFANQVALRTLSEAFVNSVRLLGKLRRTYFSYGLQTARLRLRKGSIRRPVVASSVKRVILNEGDLYRRDESVMKEIQCRLSDRISFAALTVKLEAGVWKTGPLRLSPLLPRLLNDFIALEVSLKEMASLLGRCPIFSGSYGPSVYRHFIRPLLPIYETIQVSCSNLAGLVERGMVERKASERYLKELVFDLHQAITHLARVRSQLRSRAARRLERFEFSMSESMRLSAEQSFFLESEERRFSWSESLIEPERRLVTSPERISTDGNRILGRHVPKELCIDDIVLYSAFCFIADVCLSAFVRIAAELLVDSETKIEELRGKTRKNA